MALVFNINLAAVIDRIVLVKYEEPVFGSEIDARYLWLLSCPWWNELLHWCGIGSSEGRYVDGFNAYHKWAIVVKDISKLALCMWKVVEVLHSLKVHGAVGTTITAGNDISCESHIISLKLKFYWCKMLTVLSVLQPRCSCCTNLPLTSETCKYQ